MDRSLLGKILATVTLAAIDAGQIALDPRGLVQNPQEVNQVIEGFLSIWLTHPASGADTTKPKA